MWIGRLDPHTWPGSTASFQFGGWWREADTTVAIARPAGIGPSIAPRDAVVIGRGDAALAATIPVAPVNTSREPTAALRRNVALAGWSLDRDFIGRL
jgi:hypothetical protein